MSKIREEFNRIEGGPCDLVPEIWEYVLPHMPKQNLEDLAERSYKDYKEDQIFLSEDILPDPEFFLNKNEWTKAKFLSYTGVELSGEFVSLKDQTLYDRLIQNYGLNNEMAKQFVEKSKVYREAIKTSKGLIHMLFSLFGGYKYFLKTHKKMEKKYSEFSFTPEIK